mgnify:CR=1 FL=1
MMTSDVTPKNIFYLITLIVIISFAVYGLTVLPTPYERCVETVEQSAEQRRLECMSSVVDRIECSRQYEIEKKGRCPKPAGHDWFRTDIT